MTYKEAITEIEAILKSLREEQNSIDTLPCFGTWRLDSCAAVGTCVSMNWCSAVWAFRHLALEPPLYGN